MNPPDGRNSFSFCSSTIYSRLFPSKPNISGKIGKIFLMLSAFFLSSAILSLIFTISSLNLPGIPFHCPDNLPCKIPILEIASSRLDSIFCNSNFISISFSPNIPPLSFSPLCDKLKLSFNRSNTSPSALSITPIFPPPQLSNNFEFSLLNTPISFVASVYFPFSIIVPIPNIFLGINIRLTTFIVNMTKIIATIPTNPHFQLPTPFIFIFLNFTLGNIFDHSIFSFFFTSGLGSVILSSFTVGVVGSSNFSSSASSSLDQPVHEPGIALNFDETNLSISSSSSSSVFSTFLSGKGLILNLSNLNSVLSFSSSFSTSTFDSSFLSPCDSSSNSTNFSSSSSISTS